MESIRNKIGAGIAAVFLLCGLIGLHYDWTLWVIVVPFGWIIVGCLLDFIVNGKSTSKRSGIVAIFCVLMLTNMATIFEHRDTTFIIGRLLCSIGCAIFIINTSTLTKDGRSNE